MQPGTEATECRPVGEDEILSVLRSLSAQTELVGARPVSQIVEVLGAAGERFLDNRDPLRKEALDRLPRSAGLSSEMARAVLDGMARDWTRESLDRLVSFEFQDPLVLDGFRSDRGRDLTATGPRLCVQIVSGSVPGVSVNALIRSLLVKSPTLLKPGHGDVLLPALFMRAVRGLDPELADAAAVLYWHGGSERVERAALRAADVAVLYGADDTVSALRAMTLSTTRVVVYHHRVAVCVVGRDASADEAAASVHQVARAVAMFEQRGCVCPGLVLVEDGGDSHAEQYAARLAEALEDLEETLPGAPLSIEDSAKIQQMRGTSELQAASGHGRVWHGGGDASWTVVYQPEFRPAAAVSHRGVRVLPIADVACLAELLAPMRSHLQTVGVAGLGQRGSTLALQMARLGVSRFVSIEHMSFPPPWWLHDGRGPLRDLVRWTEATAF
jgi:acyl-CoA reductase LuxC